tara:strand:- start:141 stop:317 length:177 start_codon:yes stop_codon:yes gene_type:complete
MKDPNFYKTPMGKKYYEHDLPKLIESQNRLAEAIEKQNKINEQANRLEQVKLRNRSIR